jgi:hypothetical protein
VSFVHVSTPVHAVVADRLIHFVSEDIDPGHPVRVPIETLMTI